MKLCVPSVFIFSLMVQGNVLAGVPICPEANSSYCNFKAISQQEQCLRDLDSNLKTCQSLFDKANRETIEPNKADILQRLKDKMEAAQGSANQADANITADAEIVNKVLADLDSYFSAVQANYVSLMKNFAQVYTVSEQSVQNEISDLAKTGETSDRSSVVNAIVRLQAIRSNEADLALTYRSQASLLKSNVQSLSGRIQDRLKGKTAYLESHGWGDLLDPLTSIRPPLESVLSYVSTRETYMTSKLHQVLEQLDTRLKTLQKLEIDAEIGPTLKEATYLTSVKKFMDEVEQSRLLAFKEGAHQPKLGLPYYGTQFQNLKKFLDYGKICLNSTKPKWTESGCLRFNQYQAQASKIYKGTIASFLRQNLNTIEAKYPNVLTDRVQYVRSLIDKKSYPEAVALHDSLLGSEAFQ